jgi:uncharacterized protein (UPF0276 family)
MSSFSDFKQLGFGLGLRVEHYEHIFEHKPQVDWFEIISENFMDTHGKPRRNLAKIMEHYPVVMHGVSLSIGTVDPLNSEYLSKLKALMKWVKPAWISDHLCWTGVAHKNAHDLLPVPYTEESLKHIIQRIKEVQDFLQCPIALENPSTYLEFQQSSMPESEFIARMATDSGCRLLLDVNNVYVSCFNHGLDVKAYLDALPLDRVIQIHLSGHSNKGTHIIDTHDDHVIDEVWNMYKYVVQRAGRTPNTMVEWDDHIPTFDVLQAEIAKARAAAQNTSDYVLPDLYKKPHTIIGHSDKPLEQMQQHMQKAVMLGDKFDSQPSSWIREKDVFPTHEQLNVYTNAYRYRLYDVVEQDYPVLQHYLGADDFQSLIWDFVTTAEPTHFNIGRFALKLPDFIAKTRPKDIFSHELCYLETRIAHIADYEETQVLEPHHLEGLSLESFMESVLCLRKALQLMSFNFPVNLYYQKVMDKKRANKPRRKQSFLAVFRNNDSMWRMDLEGEEYHLLEKIFNGYSIEKALESSSDVTQEQLSLWFSRWIRNGILSNNLNIEVTP